MEVALSHLSRGREGWDGHQGISMCPSAIARVDVALPWGGRLGAHVPVTSRMWEMHQGISMCLVCLSTNPRVNMPGDSRGRWDTKGTFVPWCPVKWGDIGWGQRISTSCGCHHTTSVVVKALKGWKTPNEWDLCVFWVPQCQGSALHCLGTSIWGQPMRCHLCHIPQPGSRT